MIPDKFLRTAQAEYFCNVYEFIGLGEGRELTPREVCSIKMKHQSVQEWFENLEMIGQLRVMKYLRRENERSTWTLVESIALIDT
jgi:hypothetical protein